MNLCSLITKKNGTEIIKVMDSTGKLLPGVKCLLTGVAGTPTAGLSYSGTSGKSGSSLGIIKITGIVPGPYNGTLTLAGYTTLYF
jgi:hypothetical protein